MQRSWRAAAADRTLWLLLGLLLPPALRRLISLVRRRTPQQLNRQLDRHLRLERPLVTLQLKATGQDPAVDRILEISAIKLMPGGGVEAKGLQLINPGMPIHPEVRPRKTEDLRG